MVTTGNAGSNDTIHVALSSSSFAAGTTSVAAVNGVASFSGLQINTAGSYTITASDTSRGGVATATTNSFTVNAGGESKLAITAQPATITAGGTVSVGVTVEDQFGNPITSGTGSNDTLHVALSSSSFAAGTTSVAAVNGVASFSGLQINTAGNYTITATDTTTGTVTQATTNPFTVNPGLPTKLVISAQPAATITAGGTVSVGVTIEDQFNNVVTTGNAGSNDTIHVALSSSSFAAGTTSVAAVNGVANFSGLQINTAGSYTITASDTSRGGVATATTNSFTVNAGGESKLAITAQPATITAGGGAALGVTVEDQFGNPITSGPGLTDTIHVALSSGSFAAGTTSVAATGGSASFSGLQINTAGNYTITATDTTTGTVTQATTNPFTVNPGLPTKLVISAQPASITAGGTVSVGVTIEDQFNNVVTTGNTGSTDTIQVALSSGSFAGGTTSVAAVNGVANFSGLQINTAGSYTITASDTSRGGVATATTNPFTVNPGLPNKLVISAQPAATITAGGTVSVGVTIEDQFNNVVTTGNAGSNDTIHVALSSSSFAAGTTSVAAVNGVANFSGLQINTAGSYTITASDTSRGGVATATTNSFTVNAGGESKLAITAQPATITAGGGAALGVTVEDQFGNPITSGPGLTDTIHVALSSGSFAAGTTSVAATGGSASFSGLQINTAGNYTITATDTTTGTVTQATTNPFTVNPAAANKLVFTVQPANSTGGVALPTQPQVTVEDQFSNVVTNDSSTVTLKIATSTPTSGGPGTLSGCTQSETMGVVTFSGCRINTAGTGYKLTATDGTLTSATSNAFNITVGPVAEFGVSAPGSATAGTAFNVTLTAEDAGGNTVTSYPSGSHTFAFSGPATSPGAPGTATPPSYPGTATFGVGTGTGTASGVILYDAQIVQLTATSAGISGTSANITVSAAGASKIGVISGAGQTAVVSTAFTNPLVAVVTDNYGNGVQGVSVTFAGPPTPPTTASVSFGSSGCTSNPHTYSCVATTGANGQATSSTMTADATTGTYNVVGSATGTGTVNFSETNRVNLTATSVASGTTGSRTLTTSAFNMASGTTYVVTAFASNSNTPTLTIAGTPATTLFATNNFQNNNNCADSNSCTQWAWWFTANTNATGTTISLQFSRNTNGEIADVIALSGNSTSAPIVQSNTASACNGGCTNNTTTVTANLTSAPAAGDITLQILGSDDSIGGGANAWSPATTNLYFNGAANNSAALQVDVASPGTQNESTSANGFGGSQDWGTIAVEIGHQWHS